MRGMHTVGAKKNASVQNVIALRGCSGVWYQATLDKVGGGTQKDLIGISG